MNFGTTIGGGSKGFGSRKQRPYHPTWMREKVIARIGRVRVGRLREWDLSVRHLIWRVNWKIGNQQNHLVLEQHTEKQHTIDIQPALEFISKATNQLEDRDDVVLQATKQLSLLAAMQGYDKEMIKEAMARMMENIISGESLKKRQSKKRPPSKLPKRVRIRNKRSSMMQIEKQVQQQAPQ